MKRAAEELGAFALAVQFLTRLPIPAPAVCSPERLAASVRHYPLVGGLVGALCAGCLWLADLALPSFVAVLLAVAAGLALTGAMHEDGLADSFDGIGAAGGPGDMQVNRILNAMRDSRLGAFGATALITALAIKVAALASLPPFAAGIALIVGHGLSRLSCIIVMQTSTYLRATEVASQPQGPPVSQGEGGTPPVQEAPQLPARTEAADGARSPGIATPLAGRLDALSWLTVLATSAVLLTGLFSLLGPLAAAGALAGFIAGQALMRLVLERKLRGYTGDTLGAVQQASEIGLYLGVLASMGG